MEVMDSEWEKSMCRKKHSGISGVPRQRQILFCNNKQYSVLIIAIIKHSIVYYCFAIINDNYLIEELNDHRRSWCSGSAIYFIALCMNMQQHTDAMHRDRQMHPGFGYASHVPWIIEDPKDHRGRWWPGTARCFVMFFFIHMEKHIHHL